MTKNLPFVNKLHVILSNEFPALSELLASWYCFNLKTICHFKFSIQCAITNVHLLWNVLSSWWFSIEFHCKLYKIANVDNFIYYGEIRFCIEVRKIFIIMKQVVTEMHRSRYPPHRFILNTITHYYYQDLCLITSQKITAIEMQLD